MLSLPPLVRVFLATQSTDMRRSLDGLCALVQNQREQDPFSGHLFVFLNRRLRQEYEQLRRFLYGRRRERFDDVEHKLDDGELPCPCCGKRRPPPPCWWL